MATETTSHTGRVESVRAAGTYETAYQRLTSLDLFEKSVQWAAFNKSSFTKAVGLEAFGVDAVTDLQTFGVAESTGRILRYDSGKYAYRGSIYATGPTPFHVGRNGSWTPQLVEGGDEWAYSWHELAVVEFIPRVDVEDNTAGLIDIKAQKMEGMKQAFVRDFNYCILGNASAPDAGTLSPSAVYTDLPNLISVTQTRTVGAIPTTNGFWQNQLKAITTIGGGGDMDRPLVLRRSLMDGMNDALVKAESSNDFLMVGTQGAWQYYDRLMYADAVQSGKPGAFGTVAKYDSAGIPNFAFNANPFIWDPAVTVPYGATASTECITGIHIPSYFISIRNEANFKASDWEEPREHDQYKTLVASIRLRYTPGVSQRRPHIVFYNMPACPD